VSFARFCIRLAPVYIVACIPFMLMLSTPGPHGPAFTLIGAVAAGLVMPGILVAEMLAGTFSADPYYLIFVVLFLLGIVWAWLAEFRKFKRE
jgi:hypothetical protein